MNLKLVALAALRAALALSAVAIPAALVAVAVAGTGRTATGGAAGSPASLRSPAASGDVVAGEILLDLEDGAGVARAHSFASLAGATVQRPLPPLAAASIFRLRIPGAGIQETLRIARDLASRPGVTHAEPVLLRRALYKPDDPLYKYQWHMDQVEAPAAWDLVTGKGILVAVLDTGIAYGDDPERPTRLRDLRARAFVAPYNTVDGTTDANDRQGHGSHVAGTIAQTTNNGEGVTGVAHDARLMPVKVLSDDGWGTSETVVAGIRYAADHGARVINMSLGSAYGSEIEEDAVTYAFRKGVFVACAAGNSGHDGVDFPAGCRDAVAVAAVRFDRTRAFYSSYGEKVAVSAPGGDTRSDQNGDGMPDGVLQNTIRGPGGEDNYEPFMGTSMATPHVAGAAALLMSAGCRAPSKALAALQATATKVDGDARGMGAGIIHCRAAVEKVRADQRAWQISCTLGLLVAVARVSGPGVLLPASPIPFATGLIAGATGPAALWPAWPAAAIPAVAATWLGPELGALAGAVLLPALILVTGLRVRAARWLAAGLALGGAGHLVAAVTAGVGALAPAGIAETLWLLVVAMLAVATGVLAARSGPAGR
jgi:serine protease